MVRYDDNGCVAKGALARLLACGLDRCWGLLQVQLGEQAVGLWLCVLVGLCCLVRLTRVSGLH